MQVNQQITLANQKYEVQLKKPSLANCQDFVDYWRGEFAGIAGIADDDMKAKALANLPDCATMLKRIEILNDSENFQNENSRYTSEKVQNF